MWFATSHAFSYELLESTEWAKENGIMSGDGAGNYGWDRPITREALVTVLHNFAQYLGKT